mmetsp:Transcript_16827/g.38573  ORF Transcript_16827/g.38573 Transcript_16827/m.38573 type:complete len:297 (-) Transcript_16827:104-994(-)
MSEKLQLAVRFIHFMFHLSLSIACVRYCTIQYCNYLIPLYDPPLFEKIYNVVCLGKAGQDKDAAVQHRPKHGCLVEIVRLLVIQSIPFPKKVRLVDNGVNLVFYPIQLCFQKGPVVFGTHQRSPHSLFLLLLKDVEDVFLHLLDPDMKQHGIFRASPGGPDAQFQDGVFGVGRVEKTPGGFLEFLRNGPYLVLGGIQEIPSARLEALAVDRAVFLEGFDGLFRDSNVRRSVGIGIGVCVNVRSFVVDFNGRLFRDFDRVAFGFHAGHQKFWSTMDATPACCPQEKRQGHTETIHCV